MTVEKSDVVDRLRGKKAQKSDAAMLCVEAADLIVRLRQRYSAVRRANSIALRELMSGRQKDDALRSEEEVREESQLVGLLE